MRQSAWPRGFWLSKLEEFPCNISGKSLSADQKGDSQEFWQHDLSCVYLQCVLSKVSGNSDGRLERLSDMGHGDMVAPWLSCKRGS